MKYKLLNIKLLIILAISYSFNLYSQKKFQDTIPFKDDLSLITIPITFNGIEKQFLFDTGATHSVGFSWVGKELKPSRKIANVTSSGRNQSKLRFYKSGKIRLASARISKHRILKTNDNDVFTCYNIDGILGMDIISEFNWIIDFKEKYLIMYPKDVVPESTRNMHSLNVQYKRSPHIISTTGNGKNISFLLDTGATSSDINTKTTLDINMIDARDYKTHSGSYDFNGKRDYNAINVLKRTFKSNEVIINGIFDYGSLSNKIGNRLWTGNRLFLSKEEQVLLVSNQELNEFRTNYDCSFIFHEGAIIVGHIVVDSEAWTRGLRQGDKVKSLNENTFSSFCELNEYQKKHMSEKASVIRVTLNDDSILELKPKKRFKE